MFLENLVKETERFAFVALQLRLSTLSEIVGNFSVSVNYEFTFPTASCLTLPLLLPRLLNLAWNQEYIWEYLSVSGSCSTALTMNMEKESAMVLAVQRVMLKPASASTGPQFRTYH